MAIAAIGQICSGPSMVKNLEQCVRLAGKAAAAGAKILFLPEASDYIASSPAESLRLAQPQSSSPFVTGLQAAATKHNLAIHVGIHVPVSIPSTTTTPSTSNTTVVTKLYNRTIYIHPNSTDTTPQINPSESYDKLHLFDYPASGLLESSTTQAGESSKGFTPPFHSPIGMLGSLICFDLRFPEAALHLSRPSSTSPGHPSPSIPSPREEKQEKEEEKEEQNPPAQILLYPSAFTVPTGRAGHWEVLLRARAIEGQCWVIAAAQVGRHPATADTEAEGEEKPGKRVSFGESMVVDPWGEVKLKMKGVKGDVSGQWEAEEGAVGELGLVDIDLGSWEGVRGRMPLMRR